jgi:hypothetical protein
LRALFESLKVERAAGIRALTGRREQLDFDCKRKSDETKYELDKDDKKNLGIVLSAFSNSIGGLLLWGVDARRNKQTGIDEVCAFFPISSVARFEEEIHSATPELVMPRVEKLESFTI